MASVSTTPVAGAVPRAVRLSGAARSRGSLRDPWAWVAVACLALGLLRATGGAWLALPAVQLASWLAAVAVAGRCAAVFGGTLAPRESPIVRFVVAGLLFHVIAAIVATTTGLLGVLTARAEMVIVGSMGLLASVLDRRGAGRRVPPAGLPVPPPHAGHSRLTPQTIGGQIALAIVATALGVATWNAVRYTTQDGDSMWYHLPMVAEWVRQGSIWTTEQLPLATRGYPGFREAVLTFLTLPYGNEHLAQLGPLEWALFALMIGALARIYGARPPLALAIAACAVTAPAVLTAGKGQGNNDLALALYFGMSLLALERYRRRATWRWALPAGLALGALAATKYSGPFYAAALVVLCLIRWPGRTARRIGGRRLWSVNGVVLLGSVLLVAAPWYLRNLVVFSNPLFPVRIEVAGRVLADGPATAEHLAEYTLGWRFGPLVTHARQFFQAFGPIVPILAAAPLVALALLRRRSRRRSTVLRLAILALICFVLFLHQPFNLPADNYFYNMRYLLPWFVVSVLLIAAGAGDSLRKRAAAVLPPFQGSDPRRSPFKDSGPRRPSLASPELVTGVVLLAAVGSVCMSTRAGWLVLPVTALILGARLLVGARMFQHPSLKRAARSWKLIAVVGCVAAAALLAPLRARLQYDPHFGYRDRPRKPGSGWGPISRYVHQNLRNQRIVVCGDEMLFPLYGDDLSNAVFVYRGPATANELARCCAAQGASYAVWYRECREATKSDPASGGDSRAGEATGASVEFESGSACLLRMQGAGAGAQP